MADAIHNVLAAFLLSVAVSLTPTLKYFNLVESDIVNKRATATKLGDVS